VRQASALEHGKHFHMGRVRHLIEGLNDSGLKTLQMETSRVICKGLRITGN
jgi:hypothetical protein